MPGRLGPTQRRHRLDPDLLAQHALRIDRRWWRPRFEPGTFVVSELELCGGQELLELGQRAGAEDRCRHAGGVPQPGDGNRGHADSVRGGDLRCGVEDLEVALDGAPFVGLLVARLGLPDATAARSGLLRRYRPDRKPAPSGPHASTPRPAARQKGTSSSSIDRSTSEYCACRLTNGLQPSRSWRPTHQASSHAGKFEARRARVVQQKDVYAASYGNGKGKVIARAAPGTARKVTEKPVNLLVDEFKYGSFLQNGMVLPYHYRLPRSYDPARRYPLVVVLPGHGMGWDGDNLGVQLAADIPATAWMQSKWTHRDEDVIVLAPQNQRVGAAAEGDLLLALLDRFTQDFSVDRSRVYATSVSYGSTLLWHMFAKRPELFAGGLVTGGFQISDVQAKAIAAAEVPLWVTHGINDHLLNISLGRGTNAALESAYEARGKNPEQIARLLHYTEYDNAAYSLPDYHAAFGPTYEDPTILQWLLDQSKPEG
jgi:predicted peptidase